jgi:inorganic pyrophosphatase/exopolyphosphatase
LSPLLVDTVCLDASAGRCHDLDRTWAEKLQERTGLNPQEVFARVNEAKFDVSHLSVSQLLRKVSLWASWLALDDRNRGGPPQGRPCAVCAG